MLGRERLVKSAIRIHSCFVRTIASVVGSLALAVAAAPASAQLSANDGYAADGSYKLQVEITPYLWLPATNTKFDLGPNSRISGSVSSGIPTAAQLASSLHGAFMGYTLVRYGPWSAELDFDWVEATSNNKFVSGPLGNTIGVTESASMVRVAPGFGYQFVNSAVADMPLIVDARAGFAFFHWDASISSGPPSLKGNSSFVQPWLGGRLAVYPAPQWRVTLDAAAQGFGVSGGSWGWGADLLVAYGVTDWMDVTGGFRALKSSRNEDDKGPAGNGKRIFDLLAYGPILGVGFRF